MMSGNTSFHPFVRVCGGGWPSGFSKHLDHTKTQVLFSFTLAAAFQNEDTVVPAPRSCCVFSPQLSQPVTYLGRPRASGRRREGRTGVHVPEKRLSAFQVKDGFGQRAGLNSPGNQHLWRTWVIEFRVQCSTCPCLCSASWALCESREEVGFGSGDTQWQWREKVMHIKTRSIGDETDLYTSDILVNTKNITKKSEIWVYF